MTEYKRERLRMSHLYTLRELSWGCAYPFMGMDDSSGNFRVVIPGGKAMKALLSSGYIPFAQFFDGKEQKIEER